LRATRHPRDAGHIDLAVAEFGHQIGGKPCQRRWPVWKDGTGEPPTPGTSKMIAVVCVSASRKGLPTSSSRQFREQQQAELMPAYAYRDLDRLPPSKICRTSMSPASRLPQLVLGTG